MKHSKRNSMTRRILACMLAFLLTVTSFGDCIPAFTAIAASPDYTVVVTSKSATIRKTASNSGSRIATVYQDEEYDYLDEKSVSGVDWYQIQYSASKTGWLSSKYSEKVAAGPVAEEEYRTVTITETTPVLNEINAEDTKIGVAYEGDTFRVIDEQEDSGSKFYEIEFTNNLVGWILAENAEANEVSQEEYEDIEYPDAIVRVNTTTLNVRGGHGTGYSKVATIYKNETYPVVDSYIDVVTESIWYKIRVNSKTEGWVDGAYAPAELCSYDRNPYEEPSTEPAEPVAEPDPIVVKIAAENCTVSDILGASTFNGIEYYWVTECDVSFRVAPADGYEIESVELVYGDTRTAIPFVGSEENGRYAMWWSNINPVAENVYTITINSSVTEQPDEPVIPDEPSEVPVPVTFSGEHCTINDLTGVVKDEETNEYYWDMTSDITFKISPADNYEVAGCKYSLGESETGTEIAKNSETGVYTIPASALESISDTSIVIKAAANEVTPVEPPVEDVKVKVTFSGEHVTFSDIDGVTLDEETGEYYWNATEGDDIAFSATADDDYEIVSCTAEFGDGVSQMNSPYGDYTLSGRILAKFDFDSNSVIKFTVVAEKAAAPVIKNVVFEDGNYTIDSINGAVLESEAYVWDGANDVMFLPLVNDGFKIDSIVYVGSDGEDHPIALSDGTDYYCIPASVLAEAEESVTVKVNTSSAKIEHSFAFDNEHCSLIKTSEYVDPETEETSWRIDVKTDAQYKIIDAYCRLGAGTSYDGTDAGGDYQLVLLDNDGDAYSYLLPAGAYDAAVNAKIDIVIATEYVQPQKTVILNGQNATYTDIIGLTIEFGNTYTWLACDDIQFMLYSTEGYEIDRVYYTVGTEEHEIEKDEFNYYTISSDAFDTIDADSIAISFEASIPVVHAIDFKAVNVKVTEITHLKADSMEWDGEDDITFEAEAADGYVLKSVTVTNSEEEETELTAVEGIYTIPSALFDTGDGTLTVTFEVEHEVVKPVMMVEFTGASGSSFNYSDIHGATQKNPGDTILEWGGEDDITFKVVPATGHEVLYVGYHAGSEFITLESGEDGVYTIVAEDIEQMAEAGSIIVEAATQLTPPEVIKNVTFTGTGYSVTDITGLSLEGSTGIWDGMSDVTFKIAPADGRTLKSVTAGEDEEVTTITPDDNGIYTISADDMDKIEAEMCINIITASPESEVVVEFESTGINISNITNTVISNLERHWNGLGDITFELTPVEGCELVEVYYNIEDEKIALTADDSGIYTIPSQHLEYVESGTFTVCVVGKTIAPAENDVTFTFSATSGTLDEITGLAMTENVGVWDGIHDVSFKYIPADGKKLSAVNVEYEELTKVVTPVNGVVTISANDIIADGSKSITISFVLEDDAADTKSFTFTGSLANVAVTDIYGLTPTEDNSLWDWDGSAAVSFKVSSTTGLEVTSVTVADSEASTTITPDEDGVYKLSVDAISAMAGDLITIDIETEEPSTTQSIKFTGNHFSASNITGIVSMENGVGLWNGETGISFDIAPATGYIVKSVTYLAFGEDITIMPNDSGTYVLTIEDLESMSENPVVITVHTDVAGPTKEVQFNGSDFELTDISGVEIVGGVGIWDGSNNIRFKAHGLNGKNIDTIRGEFDETSFFIIPDMDDYYNVPAYVLADMQNDVFVINVTTVAAYVEEFRTIKIVPTGPCTISSIYNATLNADGTLSTDGLRDVMFGFVVPTGYMLVSATMDGVSVKDYMNSCLIPESLIDDSGDAVYTVNLVIEEIAPIEEADKYVAVTGTGVNIRSDAGTSGTSVLGTVKIGDYFPYVGEKTVSGSTWYGFKFTSNTTAWISGTYACVVDTPPVTQIDAIDTLAQQYDVRSMQIALIENGKVTDAYSYGFATKNTDLMTNDHNIRVASLSKVIASMNMMRAQELGYLDINADISDYWGVTIKNPNYPTTPITLKHIFSHTSSISDLSYGNIKNQLQSSGSFRNVKPGSSSGWSYCNYAIGAGGATVETAIGAQTGQTINSFMDAQFNSGLGIDASYAPGRIKDKKYATLYYHDGSVARSTSTQANNMASDTPGSDTNAQYFAGGWTGSATDYAKMLAVLANDGVYDGKRYLTADSVATIETPLFTTSEHGGSFSQCLPLRYKAGYLGQDSVYYHTGNAYGVLALASYNPNTKNGVVVITCGASDTRDSQGVYAACSSISEYCYKNLISGDNEGTWTEDWV